MADEKPNQVELEQEEQMAAALTAPEVDMEALLAEERNKAAEYLENWRRSAAEFANYKRRMERDRAEFVQFANERLLKRLLEVMDSFDAGFKMVPAEFANEPWIQGMRAVERQMLKILESEGVTPIEAAGKEFDPKYHEAVVYEPSPGADEGQVLDELQRGYMLNDRVLRPARVKVAKGT